MSANNNMFQLTFVVLSSAMMAVAHCHPVAAAIPTSRPGSIQPNAHTISTAAAHSSADHHQHQQQQPATATVLNDGVADTEKPAAAVMLRGKRSLSGGSEETSGHAPSSAYAGHSIMRFGRAPHNIMHFGKRSSYDNGGDDSAASSLLEELASLDSASSTSSDPVAINQNRPHLRYVLVPMMVSGGSDSSNSYGGGVARLRGISKKAENLETTRGVFMHFG